MRPRALILSVFSLAALLLGMSVTTYAADGGWSSVIRPMVNAGTGTADYSIELFSPIYQTGDSMLFVSPRFRYNYEQDENEVNAGVGYRVMLSPDWYVGGNVFYDTLKSENHFRYHQVGVGVEARSKWVDAILNGYMPVGRDTNRLSAFDRWGLGSHALMRNDGMEQAMYGMDGEAGVLIPYVSDYVETRAYAGGYWWLSDVSKDVAGVRARVEASPAPLVTVNGVFTWDDVYGPVWRGEAYLSIPFSFENAMHGENPFEGIGDAIKFAKGARDTRARMTDRVERDRRIRTIEGASIEGIEDHAMIYVDDDNDGGAIEDGSLEHPWGTLAEAQDDPRFDNDETDPPYIYVFGGEYYGGIDLNPWGVSGRNALLWGEYYALPGMNAGGLPLLDGVGGNCGIYMNGAGDGGLSVLGMEITGCSEAAVLGVNLGSADIAYNLIHDCGYGISVGALSSILNITGNTVYGCTYTGISLSDSNDLDGMDTDISITGNVVHDCGDGIFYYVDKQYAGDINIANSGNSTSCNGLAGTGGGFGNHGEVSMHGQGDVDVTLADNEAFWNGATGLYLNVYHDGNGDATATLTDNSSDYSGVVTEYKGMGVYMQHAGTGSLTAVLAGCRANYNTCNGMLVYMEHYGGDGDMTATVDGCIATNNNDAGIDIMVTRYDFSTGNGRTSAHVSDNVFLDNGEEGDINVYVENHSNSGDNATDSAYLDGTGNEFTYLTTSVSSEFGDTFVSGDFAP